MLNVVKRSLLFGGDIAVLYFSLFLALYIRHWPAFDISTWYRHFLPFTIIYAIWLIVFYSQNLYSQRVLGNKIYFFECLARALFINAVVSAIFFYFIPYFKVAPKTILFLDISFFTVLFSFWRYIYNFFLGASIFQKNILLLGSSRLNQELARYLKNHPQLGYVLKETVERNLIGLDDLKKIIKEKQVEIIGADSSQNKEIVSVFYRALPLNVAFKNINQLYEEIFGKIPVSVLGESWFLENLKEDQKRLYELGKRLFDVVFASLILLITLPLWPLVALAIKLEDGGPIFYSQKRVGRGGEIIEVTKFRTMIKDAEKHGPLWSQKDDPRITRVGKVLRKTLLDELPQLFLILKGKMSLVGTRPERIEFVENLEKQIPYYQIRHIIKPGLTGWAQINFGYGASVEDSIQKLQYELYYIKNRSLILDLSILLKTINIIIERLIFRRL